MPTGAMTTAHSKIVCVYGHASYFKFVIEFALQ